MKSILWIPSWYPTRVEPFSGDFIERHAKAASKYSLLQVLFVVKDASLPFGIVQCEEREYENGSGAWIYYFGLGKIPFFLHPFFSFCFKIKLFSKAYKKFYTLFGKPSALHLHVALINAWIAWWLAMTKKIPLIVSEHWTGYLAEAKNEWAELSFFQKWFIKKVLADAIVVTTVSALLAKNIKSRFISIPEQVIIPNVVDTEIFKPAESFAEIGIPQFIHISTLSPQKNFGEIIEACFLLKKQGYIFRLNVYAPAENIYKKQVTDNELDDFILFKNELPQTELAKEMAASKVLILYSLFETFGCVIIEANACGVPCIVSDTAVFNENTIENITAIRLPLHRPELLAASMISFIKNERIILEKEKLVGFAKENYGMEKIGKLFATAYTKINS